MKFSVPQFIEVEDKIFGPLTLKQGIYLVGSISITIAILIKFGFIFAVLFGGPILLLAFLLAFVNIQGRPFINIFYSAIFYVVKSKLYLWKKTEEKHTDSKKTLTDDALPTSARISQSKLKQLAWSLDTNENTFDQKSKHK